MAAAHREGLAHLRLTPGAGAAHRVRPVPHPRPRRERRAARHQLATHPQRTDTEAIGALLYAALTQRWPYENDAYGLSGLPKGVGPRSRPTRSGPASTAGCPSSPCARSSTTAPPPPARSRPCTTPEELVKAVGEMPRIRPPEPAFTAPPDYQRTTYQQGTYGRPAPRPGATQPVPSPAAPAAEPHRQGPQVGRVGTADRRAGPRQLAARRRAHGPASTSPTDTDNTQTTDGNDKSGDKAQAGKPITIRAPQEYDPRAAIRSTRTTSTNTYDGDRVARTGGPRATSDGPTFGRRQAGRRHRLRPGLGEGGLGRLDRLRYAGDHTTVTLLRGGLPVVPSTPVELHAKIAATTTARPATLKLAKKPVEDPVRSRLAHRAAAGGPATSSATPATSRPSPT